MRKLLLIVILFLCTLTEQAQTPYIPFTNNLIVYGFSQVDDLYSGLQAPITFRTEITGDTLIGMHHYFKIFDGITNPVFTGGIRNDTLNKKVFRYLVSSGTEKLLYDFNLSIGDTVMSGIGYGFYAGGYSNLIDTAWVISIDSILLNYDGLFHRRFNFMAKLKYGTHDTITSDSLYNTGFGTGSGSVFMNSLIEGVGQTQGPVSEYFTASGGFAWNRINYCSSVNGIIINGIQGGPGYNPIYCNSIFLNITEKSKEDPILIFPNPSEGKFQLTFVSNKYCSLEIMDILGKIILKKELKNKTTEIDLSESLNGIYFLRLTNLNGDFLIRKIVKQ